MGACLVVFHVSVFMPVDVMQIYCSLTSVMHSAHRTHTGLPPALTLLNDLQSQSFLIICNKSL